MDIKLIWVQFLTYIAAGVAAILGGYLTHTLATQFPDMPTQLNAAFVAIGALGPGYFLHHYLDGLLDDTKTAVVSAKQTIQSQQETIAQLQSSIGQPVKK